MNEHIHEQISAFLDDELSSEESAFLVRRLTSDTLAHKQTIRYATIGSILRDEQILANSNVLRERVHAVLDGAPVSQSSARYQERRPTRWLRLATSAGLAASVALAALFGLQMLADTTSERVSPATADSGVWTEPDSYVVPGETTRSATVVEAPIYLTNLLMQHTQFTPALNRNSVHSNVISEAESDATDQATDEVQEP